MKWLFFFVFSSFPLFSYIVGNFADPSLYQDGLFFSGSRKVSFRTGYVSDYIYHQDLEDEFITIDSEPSHVNLSTYAALLAINFYNCVDIYSILGSTKIGDDQLGFVPRKFSWSVGCKATFIKWKQLRIGADIKYFETYQRPTFYILEDGEPAFVTTKFSLSYYETQASLGAAYNGDYIIPYAGATYLNSKLDPSPNFGGLEIPALDMEFVFDAKSSVNKHKWGFVFGVTFLATNKLSLNVESRHFDQSDVNVTGEIRF